METFQHQLQKFDPGVIWLDANNKVIGMNHLATSILGRNPKDLIGNEVLKLHPEKSRAKVSFLLESSQCPVKSAPPVTMMINIPDRVLLIKTTKMQGVDSEGHLGTCMVFYDVTDVTTKPAADEDSDSGESNLRRLFKLPVYTGNRVILIDLDSVLYLKADGHYTKAYTNDKSYLCNLSLSDIEKRVDTTRYSRVHRSFTVNLNAIREFRKEGERFFVVIDNASQTSIPISRGNVQKVREMLGIG